MYIIQLLVTGLLRIGYNAQPRRDLSAQISRRYFFLDIAGRYEERTPPFQHAVC